MDIGALGAGSDVRVEGARKRPAGQVRGAFWVVCDKSALHERCIMDL
jgi:hypothetical protein